jgi:hypothetical protein
VIVQKKEAGRVEISAVDPAAAIQGAKNDKLAATVKEIRTRSQKVVELL